MASPNPENPSNDTPFADLLTWLEQRTEREYDLRELADILWLAMERDRLNPSSQDSLDSGPTEQDDSVVTVIEGTDPPPATVPSADVPVPIPTKADQASLVSQSSPELEREFGSPVPIALSAPSPLVNALALSRALYPLMRRVPSPNRNYLDEEATVTQIADQRIKLPVMRPEPERWLELALIVEDTSILDIWQETLAAFQKLVERHGAFRDVRTWYLKNEAGEISLSRKRQGKANVSRSVSPTHIADATGRRLILLVSDCTSGLWMSGELPQQLARWSRQSPVTLLQLLPAMQWDRSVLGKGYDVWLSAQAPGSLNHALQQEDLRLRPRERQQLEEKHLSLFNLPVITLDEEPMRDWAKVLAGESSAETAGVALGVPRGWQEASRSSQEATRLGLAQKPDAASNSSPATREPSARQLVAQFWKTASPPARKLAGMMARQPVSLPVARLVQREFLDEKHQQPFILAEIFLSGLIRATAPSSDGPEGGQRKTVWCYDFVPGVRDLLFKVTPLSTTEDVQWEVIEGVQSQLPEEAKRQIQAEREQLSEAIERELGLSRRQFEAFLVPGLLKQWWDEQGEGDASLGDVITSLAELSVPTLRARGGVFAELADRLPQVMTNAAVVDVPRAGGEQEEPQLPIEFVPLELETVQLVEAETVEWPPLQTETITFATVTLEASGDGLEQFTFETATIAKQQQRQGLPGGLFNRQQQQQNQWTITKQQGSADRFVELLPSDVARKGDIELQMVAIPGGSFTMGSPEDEPERNSSRESPQHEVTLQPFYMARYPVTQAQWRAVAHLQQIDRKLEPSPSRFEGDDRPVERVSWEDAVEFCQRLSQLTEREYRLPTEAEWEYACRAGTTTAFHFGDMMTTELANYNGRSYADGPKGQSRGKTTPVGEFPANAWGLHDMHGNVREWCQDIWHKNYEGAPIDGSAWLTDGDDQLRIRRGGSWIGTPGDCRSAYRNGYEPGNRISNFGFRVVCVAPRA